MEVKIHPRTTSDVCLGSDVRLMHRRKHGGHWSQQLRFGLLAAQDGKSASRKRSQLLKCGIFWCNVCYFVCRSEQIWSPETSRHEWLHWNKLYQTFHHVKGYSSLHLPLPPLKILTAMHRWDDWLWNWLFKKKEGKTKKIRCYFCCLKEKKTRVIYQQVKKSPVADWEQIPAANITFGRKSETRRVETACDESQSRPAA